VNFARAEPARARPSKAASVPLDAELVRQALHGDRDALAELLLRHWRTATFLASRVLGSPDLANDAVQEAAIAAMTNLDRLRSPDRFGAWFCGIALNVSRGWIRQLRAEIPAVLTDRESGEMGPAEVAEIADLGRRVRAAIDQLPVGQREAVLLFYLQGLSHREVAAELEISPGAVKARLHQARAALAPRLAPMIQNAKEQAMTTSDATRWVDAEVAEVRRTEADDPEQRKHIVILAEQGGERRLPIWIGPAEATALALALESAETPRPFTYKLAASLLAAAHATVAEVRITRLDPPVFFASVLVRAGTETREVDARPSDAVNLALTTGAPIKIDRLLFDLPCPDEHAAELLAAPAAAADIAGEAMRRYTGQTRR
jgi:RNA polymerase sigma factor (sigma-70 family)